jgi:hypothetical protein
MRDSRNPVGYCSSQTRVNDREHPCAERPCRPHCWAARREQYGLFYGTLDALQLQDK